MPVSRRTLLTGGVALMCGRSLALAQKAQAPVIIELPDLPLYPEAPTIVAVNTSGYTSCAVAILDSDRVLRGETRDWSTSPDVSNGVQLSLRGSGHDPAVPRPHTVKVTM